MAGEEVGLLLDEMFSPVIAAELSKLGHDVIAVVDRPDLRSESDEEIFAWASTDKRRLLTENVKDFRPIMLRALPTGPLCGLLFTSSRAFSRSRKNFRLADQGTGRMVVPVSPSVLSAS